MNKIKVALVSFKLKKVDGTNHKEEKKDFENLKKIIIEPNYNLIMFPGWALNVSRIDELNEYIKEETEKNQEIFKNKLVIIETYFSKLSKDGVDTLQKKETDEKKRVVYIIKDGKLTNTNIVQLFHNSTSAKIDKLEKLLTELENNTNPQRIIEFMNKNILILVCGELFLLRNKEKSGIASVRYPELETRFENIFRKVQVVANIVHTPFETSDDKEEKEIDYDCYRVYLSTKYIDSNYYYYISTSNGYTLTEPKIQVVFKNQIISKLKKVNPPTDYLLQTYDIE